MDLKKVRDESVKATREELAQRVSEINGLCAAAHRPELAGEYIAGEMSTTDISKELLKMGAKGSEDSNIQSHVPDQAGRNHLFEQCQHLAAEAKERKVV